MTPALAKLHANTVNGRTLLYFATEVRLTLSTEKMADIDVKAIVARDYDRYLLDNRVVDLWLGIGSTHKDRFNFENMEN